MMLPMTQTIFGAGQVGLHLAKQLAAAGHDVRLVRRGPAGEALPRVTWVQGDATDRAVADAACRGATTVYNCANPSDYARWEGVLEPLYTGIREAAGRAGARLVQLENVYMYGRPQGPFAEDAPMTPCSRKGELRLGILSATMDAHRRGDVEVAVGHASDFFGPATPRTTTFRPDVARVICRGGTAWVFGNPDMLHSYSYTPDVARGLAVLGTHPEAAGKRWHLPVAAQESTRSLIARMARLSGNRVRVRAVPDVWLRVGGWFSPLMRALREMSYQWDVPYVLDDTAFRLTFKIEATPIEQAIADSLASWRSESSTSEHARGANVAAAHEA
jgi:nucleoside-diphosphate-sugar epimerase